MSSECFIFSEVSNFSSTYTRIVESYSIVGNKIIERSSFRYHILNYPNVLRSESLKMLLFLLVSLSLFALAVVCCPSGQHGGTNSQHNSLSKFHDFSARRQYSIFSDRSRCSSLLWNWHYIFGVFFLVRSLLTNGYN